MLRTLPALCAIVVGLGLVGTSTLTAQADDGNLAVTIKDHKFDPAEIAIPAGKEVKLLVTNADGTAEEFESEKLDIEKVIAPGQRAEIKIGPLDAGTYEFVGEYHEDTAKGTIVVK